MQIREYRVGDRESVVTLWKEVFPNNSAGHNDPSFTIDRKREVNDGLFFVAVEDHKLVGTIIAGYDGHRGWLYSLAVRPGQRRRGIGTRLVRHAEAALAQRGCAKVNLQVRAENAEVMAFYESLGYLTEQRVSMGRLLQD